MVTIALRSLLRQRGAAAATATVCGIGTLLVAGLAGVFASGLAPETRQQDRPFLIEFPVILGGWSLAIVIFAVMSTVGVTVDGRDAETRALRITGATPAQIKRMTMIETMAAASIAVIPSTALSYVFGGALVGMIRGNGLIATPSAFRPGILLPAAAALVVVLHAGLGGYLGSGRISRSSPVAARYSSARTETPQKGRLVAAAGLLGIGLTSAVSALATDPQGIGATAMTGPGCVLVSVGAALLAPELLAVGRMVADFGRAEHRTASRGLAVRNLHAAPERSGPIVTFLTLFVGVAAGTLSMQRIENSVTTDTHGIETVLASINYLVVGLIAVFMAIALINNVLAALRRRRHEFHVMALVGATASQTLRTTLQESAVAVVTAGVSGVASAVVTVLPFAILKTGQPWSALAPLPYLGVCSVGACIVLGASLLGWRMARPRKADQLSAGGRNQTR